MAINTTAGLLDAIVLAVVGREETGTYGYKITQEVRTVLDLSESTLYPVLRRLQKDGCLTVSAAKGLDKDEEDKKGRYIRQERYAGSLSRSFYVGEDVEPQDVKAKYENGVLKLFVPKAEVKQVPAQTAIAIE